MADPADPNAPGNAGARTAFGMRFTPHVLVVLATFGAMYYAAHGAVVGFVHAYWASSYRTVAFVMDEWRPNDGYPYVAGHLADSTEPAPFHLVGAVVGGNRMLAEAPTVAFASGATVPVWYSPDAPMFSYAGEWTNGVPVAALPVRPGWGKVVVHALATLAIAVAGFFATVWVAARFTRRAGSLPITRR